MKLLIYRVFTILYTVSLFSVIAMGKWIGQIFNSKDSFSFTGFVLAKSFEKLGGTFVKLGQIISTRPDIFSEKISQQLIPLQDRVSPFNIDLIAQIVYDNFSKKIEEVFIDFNKNPISCGGIANVHRAKLRSGEEVAVKIRRPNIVRHIQSDFLILEALAKGLSYLPFLRVLPFENLIQDFKKTIAGQVDFIAEVNANKRMAVNFQENKLIVIPKLYETYCTAEIIVMEYIPDLKKYEDLDFDAAEKEELARVALSAIYQMMFVDGFIHGDLHPGNLFFLDTKKVLLLDFGLIAELKGKEKDDYVDFFFGIATNNGEECARVVYETALYLLPKFEYKKFEKEIVDMVDRFYALDVKDFEVSAFAFELFNIERRNGIKGATHFITTILSLVIFEGVIKQLSPNLDFQYEAKQIILQEVA